MRTMLGRVLIAQEGRFLLQSGQGDTHLYLLSPRASLEPQQLAQLQREQALVRVAYCEPPDLIARVAHNIERVAGSAASLAA